LSMDISIVCRGGLRLTANCGCPLVSVMLIRFHRLLPGRRFLNVVTKLNCSGRPWLKILRVGMTSWAVESIR